MRLRSLLAGASALAWLCCAPVLAQDKPFAGVTVNVITQTGAIQEPLQRRAPEFEALTGAKINVIAVPFSDLYQKVLTDWASGTNSVDAAVFAPQWMVDYIAGGYLDDLTPRIAADPDIQEDDVGAFFRDFSQKYGDKTYMITLDGDFHMMYYRTDVLEAAGKKPPTTWDEYLDVAKAVNGQDMNGDGTPDFGSCIAKKRNAQSYWFVTDVVGSMTQSKGTSQGTFFNTADMTPLVDNAAFRKALDFLQASTEYGPPDELNLDVSDTRPLFASGRCALNLDWGDVGTISIDPNQSKVMGKWGAAIMPGSKEVLDWETRRARGLRRRDLPPRHRRRQPRALRGLRRLGRRHQRRGGPEGEGRGLRLLLVHDPAGAVELRRDGRRHRLQPVPDLAARLLRPLEERRDERGGGEGLPRRDQREHVEPEHDPRPAHPAEPEVPAGRARRGDLALPLRARSTRRRRSRRSPTAGTSSTRRSASTSSSSSTGRRSARP